MTAVLLSASSAGCQIPVVLFGRVHDAVSAAPVVGALIVSEDAASATRTDARGMFAIELQGPGPYVVFAVHEGYEATEFELAPSARSAVSTLLLQPAVTMQDLVEPGDRVRIWSDHVTGEFQVAGVGSDGLVLRIPGGSTELQMPTVSRLEIHRGRRISTLKGVMGGVLVGGLLGGALGTQCLQTHYDCVSGFSMASGAAIGASVGSLLGLFVSHRSADVWEEVDIPREQPPSH